MHKQYVLASGNAGKLREINAVLGPLGCAVRPQGEWQVPEVEETGATFLENALAKARQAARFTRLPALADDSGLIVPALRGEPGIYSARYAGRAASDADNVRRLLERMEGLTEAERRAYFYCCIVLLDSPEDPAPLMATARWYGEILHAPRGTNGFGYDPVFAVAGGTEQYSAAELSLEAKQRISHRGQALQSLVRQLREQDRICR
ncbi:MAG: RdgB/HAM1 family non-canonical purine NTP pyrophosphatase [Lysobacterales bacterium]|jgi:XTP/dITP diphosphohydrolase